MAITSLLKLGRAMGADNFSQIKNLARAITGNASSGRAHIVFDKKIADALADFSGGLAPEHRRVLNICEYYNPKASEKGAKTIYDIAFNRYGEKSGSVLLKGKGISSEGEVYSTMKFKGLFNEAGGRVYGRTSMPSANVSGDVDVAILNKMAPKKEKLDLLAKSVKYNTHDGISTFSIAPISANGGKVQGCVQAPTGFFNDIVRVATDYEFMDFGSMLKSFLKI